MAKAVCYQTHTGLLIALEKEDGEYVVTITGNRVKELLRTPLRGAARKFYGSLVKDYEARAKDEAVPA